MGELMRLENVDDLTVVGVRVPQSPLMPRWWNGRHARFRPVCLRV